MVLVFRSIAENVKSFFVKEEELEHDAKKAPDAAIELYEKPISKDHHIVDHKLGATPPPLASGSPAATPVPKLPFSSAQLRERLVATAARPSEPQPAPSSALPVSPSSASSPVERQEVRQPEVHEEDISSQIAEFEQAMGAVPGAEAFGSEHAVSSPRSQTGAAWPYGEGFFADVARRLKERGYDDAALENALGQMKRHHAQRHAESQQRVKQQELEHGLSQKLAELQGLEREWAAKSGEVEAARQRMAELEGMIAERTGELRELVSLIREQGGSLDESALEPGSTPGPESVPESVPESAPDVVPRSVPEAVPEQGPRDYGGHVPAPEAAHSFILADGQELVTMQDLREALLSMGDATFHHHVTPERNDFSTWILDVFKDRGLAERVRHASNRYVMAQLLG